MATSENLRDIDNDEKIIVGYDGDDKIVAVNSVTTRHQETYIEYANRKSPKDQIVWCRGDYNNISKLILKKYCELVKSLWNNKTQNVKELHKITKFPVRHYIVELLNSKQPKI